MGFLAQAGTLVQDRLTAVLPTTVAVPALPYAAELQATFDELKADENLKDKVAGVEFPDLTSKSTIEIEPNGGGTLPDDLVDLLKTADVTNIVERSKTVATRMFDEQTPARVAEIQDGVQKGLDSLTDARFVVTQPTPGVYKAFDRTCTHMDCPVKKVEGGGIVCACHGSRFALEDGSVLAGPATRPLTPRTVTVRGDVLDLAP